MDETRDDQRQTAYHIIYMWNLKKKRYIVNLFTKQKQTYRHRKKLWERRGGAGGWERDTLGGRD